MDFDSNELLKRYGSPATELLGTEILAMDVNAGTASFRFRALESFVNVLGNIQGGFAAAMLDEAAGLTARLTSSEGLYVPTLDFHVSFVRPVPVGTVWSEGRCVKIGRRIAFIEADLRDDQERLLSTIRVTALTDWIR